MQGLQSFFIKFVHLSGNFFENGSIELRSVFLFVEDTFRIKRKTIKHPEIIQENKVWIVEILIYRVFQIT